MQLLAGFWPLYRSWRIASLAAEIRQAGLCWLGSASIVSLASYVVDPFPDGARPLLPLWVFLWGSGLLATRILVRLTLRSLRIRGRNYRVAAIAGANELGGRLARQFRGTAWMGVKVIGFFDDRMVAPTRVAEGVSTDGTFDKLISRVRAGEIDSVYITLPLRAELRVRHIVERLRDSTATVLYVPDFSAFGLLGARWEVVDGVTIVSLIDTPHQGASAMLKRLFDIAVASASLAVVALPMLLIACAIKLTSAGPVVFRQKRYGLDGDRSRYGSSGRWSRSKTARPDSSRRVATMPGSRGWGRCFAAHRWTSCRSSSTYCRAGCRSVGPRPHPVALNETHRKLIEGYMLRHKVKPGITGWARDQRLSRRNRYTGEDARTNRARPRVHRPLSLMLDIRIILLTLRRAWADSNAY